jgi:hypothetical protein|tara:strand:+ start:418 stop:879 length:462 start_codon:yes stop_codon:yes gene_type:complete
MVEAEERRENLRARFLPLLAKEANLKGVICGNVTKVWTISKTVAKGIKMIYVVRMNTARVEMWIYHGKNEKDIDSAHDVFKHFLSKKSQIEMAYCFPLNWDHKSRRTAFSIQQDYPEFQLSDETKWNYWIEKMVTDMKKLDDSLLPHYITSRD